MADIPIYPGFDTHWQSVPDFVLGLTWEVWEGRGVSALSDYLAPEVIVRAADQVTQGAPGMLGTTLSTLAEFPDLQLLGEDVIWGETKAKDAHTAGFHASHRMTCTATHLGAGRFGAATGKALRYRILCDSWCAENRIHDQWSVRDHGALVRQLGQTPRHWCETQIVQEGGPARCIAPLTPDSDREGPYFGRGSETGPGQDLAGILRDIMSGAFSVIPERYDRACELAYPGGETAIGHAGADRFWLGLRSSFPSAAFRVEHCTGMTETGQPPRAALRWSLYGKHDGPGLFGAPTGCFVYVMGITHAEFGPRGLRREWTLIDECAIWKQILMATG